MGSLPLVAATTPSAGIVSRAEGAPPPQPAKLEFIAERDPTPETQSPAPRGLGSVEAALIARHRDALGGDVLELLPSGGGLTEALVSAAGSYTGIGPSAAMISLCRHFHGTGTFIRGEVFDLAAFGEGQFGLVFAGQGLVDSLGSDQRGSVLDEARRVLRSDGLFILCSHNLASETVEPEAGTRRKGLAGRLAGKLRRSGESATDTCHRLTRDDEEHELTEHGFWLLECRDLDDRLVAPGEQASGSERLHYVARPV